MGKDLPDYEEIPVPIEMPEDVQNAYKKIEKNIRQVLKSNRKAAQKLMSAYLNLLTVYPDEPYGQPDIVHPIDGHIIAHPSSETCFDDILPKETAVLEKVREKISAGGRVMIYTSWTCTDSQQMPLKLLTSEGIRTEILLPSVPLEKRESWGGEAGPLWLPGADYESKMCGKCCACPEGFLFSTWLIQENYIDTDFLTSSLKNQFAVLTDVSELRKSLGSVSCVDPDGKVRLSFDGTALTVQCNGVHGSAQDTISVAPLTGISQGEYWFLTRQLTNCLRSLSGTATLGIAAGGMMMLDTEHAFYMQTGVRPGTVQPASPSDRKTA